MPNMHTLQRNEKVIQTESVALTSRLSKYQLKIMFTVHTQVNSSEDILLYIACKSKQNAIDRKKKFKKITLIER